MEKRLAELLLLPNLKDRDYKEESTEEQGYSKYDGEKIVNFVVWLDNGQCIGAVPESAIHYGETRICLFPAQ